MPLVTPARFKRAGVGTNGILECKFRSKKKEPTQLRSTVSLAVDVPLAVTDWQRCAI
jgi:hypothetical protein